METPIYSKGVRTHIYTLNNVRPIFTMGRAYPSKMAQHCLKWHDNVKSEDPTWRCIAWDMVFIKVTKQSAAKRG